LVSSTYLFSIPGYSVAGILYPGGRFILGIGTNTISLSKLVIEEELLGEELLGEELLGEELLGEEFLGEEFLGEEFLGETVFGTNDEIGELTLY